MRSANEIDDFPYGSRRVCYIGVDTNGHVYQIRNSHTEIEMAYNNAVGNKTKIFAVWPGEYRSDLFMVEDLAALADAFGVDRPDDHQHIITASLSPYDDGKSQYADVEVGFECGCVLNNNNLKKIANDMKKQKGWDMATSVGWSAHGNGQQMTYTLRVRRSTFK